MLIYFFRESKLAYSLSCVVALSELIEKNWSNLISIKAYIAWVHLLVEHETRRTVMRTDDCVLAVDRSES